MTSAIDTLERLLVVAGCLDERTHNHTARVGQVSAGLAAAPGAAREQAPVLRRAAAIMTLARLASLTAIAPEADLREVDFTRSN